MALDVLGYKFDVFDQWYLKEYFFSFYKKNLLKNK